jgi:hypothetical protein
MKVEWIISPSDIEKTLNFVKQMESKKYVKRRMQYNVLLPPQEISRNEIWETLFDCLLSTQQKSGPNSAIANFLNLKPFPFSYDRCLKEKNIQDFVTKRLTEHGGIRRTSDIGKSVEYNLNWLETGGWTKLDKLIGILKEQRKQTPGLEHKKCERQISHKIGGFFRGIGQKQSRNYLQLLGLTRYEIPIDSRFVKWLAENRFPLVIANVSINTVDKKEKKRIIQHLTEPDWYDAILDKIQELCYKGKILPCILDASVFASFDEEWEEDKIPF